MPPEHRKLDIMWKKVFPRPTCLLNLMAGRYFKVGRVMQSQQQVS